MSGALTKDLTAHDFLKAFAVITMIVDHLGYFFWPDETWFRIIGRLSPPVWFYLIGYADKRTVQNGIWIGGVVIVLSRVFTGQHLFPIDILFALGVFRLMIDGLMARALRTNQTLWGVFTLLLFTSIISMMAVEYGTLGLMFCMFGYMRRHKELIAITPAMQGAFMAAACLAYIVIQIPLMPPFNAQQLLVLFAGMAVLGALLFFFTPATFPRLTRVTGPLAPLIRLMGRRTLEIYVLHILLFTALAVVYFPSRFAPSGFQIVPPGLMQFFVQ